LIFTTISPLIVPTRWTGVLEWPDDLHIGLAAPDMKLLHDSSSIGVVDE
jgi:hypothetical protein